MDVQGRGRLWAEPPPSDHDRRLWSERGHRPDHEDAAICSPRYRLRLGGDPFERGPLAGRGLRRLRQESGLGTLITGPSYSRGANIRDLFRISPRLVYNSGKLRLAVEAELTSAAYGTPDARGQVRRRDPGHEPPPAPGDLLFLLRLRIPALIIFPPATKEDDMTEEAPRLFVGGRFALGAAPLPPACRSPGRRPGVDRVRQGSSRGRLHRAHPGRVRQRSLHAQGAGAARHRRVPRREHCGRESDRGQRGRRPAGQDGPVPGRRRPPRLRPGRAGRDVPDRQDRGGTEDHVLEGRRGRPRARREAGRSRRAQGRA